MFQPIKEYAIERRKPYKIIDGDEYKGKFKKSYQRFGNYKRYLEFNHVFNMTTQTNCEDLFFFSWTCKFYEFVPQKARIQSDMERRALNMIIRRLLGDDCFEW